MRKHGLPLMHVFPSAILPLYGKIRIRFCPYTEKHGSVKSRVSVYFTLWLRGNYTFLLDWLHHFNVSKINCDRTTCKWSYQRKVIKTISSSNFLLSYFFLLQTVSHCKSKPVTMFWKTAVNKDFAKLEGKNLVSIKSWNPSQDFQQFSEKFYNGCF